MNNLYPTSIPAFLNRLNPHEGSPTDFLTSFEEKFDQIEDEVLAFIPEENRFDRLRSELQSARLRGLTSNSDYPLLGLLIGVKDIFHADGFPTKAGSHLPTKILTGPEASCVTTLKNLGALILGKTVTTEFAYFAPGPTKNPHNLAHTPGGSSSGSAAAVAAGLTPFTLGSQTIGSIIRPASYCGIVGFKPTYGRIPTNGVIPLAPSVDTIGYFTSTVTDALHIAPYLCENWQPPTKKRSKPVLGIPIGPYLYNAEPEMLVHFQKISAILNRNGYRTIEIPAIHNFEMITHYHHLLVAYEAAQTHKNWFAKYGECYHPKTTELILRGQRSPTNEYQEALVSCKELRYSLTKLMNSKKIDVWISPSAQGPPPSGLDSTGNPIMNLPWTHCGFPTLSIPSGQNEFGLPLGLQVSARWQDDESLLTWGADIAEFLA